MRLGPELLSPSCRTTAPPAVPAHSICWSGRLLLWSRVQFLPSLPLLLLPPLARSLHGNHLAHSAHQWASPGTPRAARPSHVPGPCFSHHLAWIHNAQQPSSLRVLSYSNSLERMGLEGFCDLWMLVSTCVTETPSLPCLGETWMPSLMWLFQKQKHLLPKRSGISTHLSPLRGSSPTPSFPSLT